jgi:hypothetical protein
MLDGIRSEWWAPSDQNAWTASLGIRSRTVHRRTSTGTGSGNVASETEQHLKHEFRKLGWDASDPTLAAAIGVEIDRLKREAATLHKLRAVLFGVA